jgi:predicted GNAT superfamily acetyltransferase
VILRALAPADFAAVLRLNADNVAFLSAMDAPRLAHLHAQAALSVVVEEGAGIHAFLLAFREGADYDSVNYQWFATRYPRFLYVDRVVVGAAARTRGLGTRLYQHVFEQARNDGVPLVTCEIDSDPPNVASEHFHARFGFTEVGTQRVPYAPKLVSLRVAPVPGRG